MKTRHILAVLATLACTAAHADYDAKMEAQEAARRVVDPGQQDRDDRERRVGRLPVEGELHLGERVVVRLAPRGETQHNGSARSLLISWRSRAFACGRRDGPRSTVTSAGLVPGVRECRPQAASNPEGPTGSLR